MSARVKPVCVLRAVTITPGTAAPWVSTIRPLMFPVVCCASAGRASATAHTAIIATMNFLMPAGLLT
jgi:hypothetical protein